MSISSLFASLLRAAPRLVFALAVAALSVPAAVAATFWGRGSIEHLLLVLVPALVIGPALLVAGVLLWLYGLRTHDQRNGGRMRWLAAALVGLAGFTFGLAPSYLPGLVLHYRDVGRARQYCSDLIPRLEAWKEENGRYPAAIAPVLPAERKTPRLLAERVFYHRLGSGYELIFPDPASASGGYSFFSPDSVSRGRWEHWD